MNGNTNVLGCASGVAAQPQVNLMAGSSAPQSVV